MPHLRQRKGCCALSIRMDPALSALLKDTGQESLLQHYNNLQEKQQQQLMIQLKVLVDQHRMHLCLHNSFVVLNALSLPRILTILH